MSEYLRRVQKNAPPPIVAVCICRTRKIDGKLYAAISPACRIHGEKIDLHITNLGAQQPMD